jgi:hypothetical protein
MWPRSGKTSKNWNKLTRKEGDGNGGLSAFCFWEVPLRAFEFSERERGERREKKKSYNKLYNLVLGLNYF